jgi:hypothetical protein
MTNGDTSMNQPVMRFPVTCPECGAEALGEFPVAEVAIALMTKRNCLRLYAACHGHQWLASLIELQKIREYLGEPWLVGAAGPRTEPLRGRKSAQTATRYR